MHVNILEEEWTKLCLMISYHTHSVTLENASSTIHSSETLKKKMNQFYSKSAKLDPKKCSIK